MSLLSQSCDEATRWISEARDGNLPLGARIGLRLHLAICRQCRRYERQVRLMRSVFLQYAEHLPPQPLPDGFQERIVRSLEGDSD